MLCSTLILALAALALADVTPVAPGPGDIFLAGSNCTIKWDVDTNGTWTNVTIDLMSGSNDNMTVVTPVTSGLDGTDPRLTPYSWTCPEVDPYSAIYFYQFTNGDDRMNSTWTTRFTIASSSNQTVPPEHSQQPNGDPIPWGNGALVADNNNSSVSRFTMGNDTDSGDDSNNGNGDATTTTDSDGHHHHSTDDPQPTSDADQSTDSDDLDDSGADSSSDDSSDDSSMTSDFVTSSRMKKVYSKTASHSFKFTVTGKLAPTMHLPSGIDKAASTVSYSTPTTTVTPFASSTSASMAGVGGIKLASNSVVRVETIGCPLLALLLVTIVAVLYL